MVESRDYSIQYGLHWAVFRVFSTSRLVSLLADRAEVEFFARIGEAPLHHIPPACDDTFSRLRCLAVSLGINSDARIDFGADLALE